MALNTSHPQRSGFPLAYPIGRVCKLRDATLWGIIGSVLTVMVQISGKVSMCVYVSMNCMEWQSTMGKLLRRVCWVVPALSLIGRCYFEAWYHHVRHMHDCMWVGVWAKIRWARTAEGKDLDGLTVESNLIGFWIWKLVCHCTARWSGIIVLYHQTMVLFLFYNAHLQFQLLSAVASVHIPVSQL